MKCLYLFLSLLVIQSSFAQTKTGSGGGLDEKTPHDVIFNEGTIFFDASSGVRKGFDGINVSGAGANFLNEMAQILHTQNNKCVSATQGVDMKYMNFMNIYYYLSVTHTSAVLQRTCSEKQTYFDCMGNSPAMKKVLDILNRKDSKIFLNSVYKMNDAQVKSLIKFFEQLDQSCGEDVCKM